jgi:hypothetical protein
VKEFLSRSGQPFVVKLVDEDDTAFEELMGLGVRSVPVTLVDGEIIHGFDQVRLRDALEKRSTADR